MNRKGFTLTELIIVLGIMAVVASILWASAVKLSVSYKKNTVEKLASLITEQVQRYDKLQGHFPFTQEEFENFLANGEYFQSVPKNPFWDGKPEEGWKWDASSKTLSAVNNAEQTVYSITVSVPTGNSGPYNRPSQYGGDG